MLRLLSIKTWLFVLCVCFAQNSLAERYTGPHQFTRADYVTVRSLQVCVNRQGWENDQESNDNKLEQILRDRNIEFSFAKLMRENYKYEYGVRGSIRAEVDFEIADAIKACMQTSIFPETAE